jgi:PST family polysaccharide transporter
MWSGLSSAITTALRLIIMGLLAWLLEPEAFGMIAAAVFFVDLGNIVYELGLGAAVVQRKEIDAIYLSTAFWASLAVGIVLTVLMVGASPAIAAYYRIPQVQSIVTALSLGFIITPLGLINRVILQRELDFRRVAFAEIGSVLVMGAISISLAWLGFGAWSLVWGTIAQKAAAVILLWWLVPWRPSVAWSAYAFRDMFGFGIYITGERFVNYLANNVDYLIVGRWLGKDALGYYSLAFQLMSLPLTRISLLVSRVMFPAFSRVQDEEQRFQRGYLSTIRYVALLSFPMLAVLFWTAPEFLTLLGGGDKWEPAILPLQIMCIAGMIRSVVSTVGSVLKAKGRPDIGFRWNLIWLVATAAGVFVGSRYGIVGVAWAITVITIIVTPFIQGITNKLINLSWRRYFAALQPAIIAVVVVSAGIGPIRLLTTVQLGWAPLPSLLINLAAGGLGYLLTLYFTGMLFEMRTLLGSVLHLDLRQ